MRTISTKSQLSEQYYQELTWIQYNLEILETTDPLKIKAQVLEMLPQVKDSPLVRGYEDWRRYAISHLDGWEKAFLINAALQVEVLEKKQNYSDQLYQLMGDLA